ncbi:tRNA epoxyqueuosine(34) reductase QueG [Roseimaritima multifibrata]|nr:tRNA epoxyqueuosine(34) reductase QueG [Roseimaritima multifibrata]
MEPALSSVDPVELAAWLRQQASDHGFHLFGITQAATPNGFHHLSDWIEAGYAAEMDYIPKRLTAYEHPRHVMEGAQSLVMLGFPYRTSSPRTPGPLQGRVAKYAWGSADYHDLIHARLKQIKKTLAKNHPAIGCRGVVDSAPLMEREFAELAGLGWTGKNTLLINKLEGSYFLLSCLLLDVPLPASLPHATDHCGTCQRCLEACPTDAFVSPGILDSRRCISYLTIEHRDPIPHDLRPLMGDWLFGCDVCQDVCPWNRRGSEATDEAFEAAEDLNPIDLPGLFEWDDDQFRARFRKSPLWRTRRRGILRNAAIVLGNQGDPAAIPALRQGCLQDPESLVRGAAAWALGQIATPESHAVLIGAAETEIDPEVREEISAAIASIKK